MQNYLFLITENHETTHETQQQNPDWQIIPIGLGPNKQLESWLTEHIPETGNYRLLLDNQTKAKNESRCMLILQRLAQAISIWQHNAKIARERHWRWGINCLRNLSEGLFIKPTLQAEHILLLAAGPNLSQFIESGTLYRYINSLIIALPPAITVLNNYNLKPDLIISADHGYWAKRHLIPANPTTPIAHLLRAALPAQHTGPNIPIAVSPTERLLWNIFYQPSIPQSQDGPTVAAIALSWLRKQTAAPITIAGMDLSITNERFHALPHTYDTGHLAVSGREEPTENKHYTRVLHAELEPLSEYWFTTKELRLFRISIDNRLTHINQLGPTETLTYPSATTPRNHTSNYTPSITTSGYYLRRTRHESIRQLSKLWQHIEPTLYGVQAPEDFRQQIIRYIQS